MSLFSVVWPCRTAPQRLNPDTVFAVYETALCKIEAAPESSDDPVLLEQSWKLFAEDEARRTSIEGRAGALMPAIGLAAALVTGVGFTVMKDLSGFPPPAKWVVLITYVGTLAYLVRTTLLLFVVHGPMARSTPDPSDLPPPPPVNAVAGEISRYHRELARRILRYTINNYKVSNVQMNALAVAQQAFRNAIALLVIGGIITAVLFFARGMLGHPCIFT